MKISRPKAKYVPAKLGGIVGEDVIEMFVNGETVDNVQKELAKRGVNVHIQTLYKFRSHPLHSKRIAERVMQYEKEIKERIPCSRSYIRQLRNERLYHKAEENDNLELALRANHEAREEADKDKAPIGTANQYNNFNFFDLQDLLESQKSQLEELRAKRMNLIEMSKEVEHAVQG
jgi:hypothetical protein